MQTELTRQQKIERLALLEERNRRRERARLETDRTEILRRCRTLAGFVREAWPVLEPSARYVHGWHIDAVCAHLEAITDGRLTRLLINIPPGTMKSLLVSVFWPAWEWGPRGLPSMRYLTTSYNEDYVKRDSRRMRDLVTSEWYRTLWGDTVRLVRTGEASFANDETGFREGVPFKSMTGGRGDRVIIDDPHSTETAESDADRAATTRIFRESVPTRVNDQDRSAIVVIMQRLHQDDVSGQIAKLGLPYEHLMLPMEFDPDRACTTSIGFKDPRSYDGELLFPERFSRGAVDALKKQLGSYASAGQLDQRPTAREGGLFKRHWFRTVEALPMVQSRTRAWDFAATKKKATNRPDWTAGLRMARCDGGLYVVENVRRLQGSPGEVEQLLKTTAATDQLTGPTRVRIPQDPGQAGVAQKDAFIKALAGYDVAAKTVTGDKETRARPAAAQAEAGNIAILVSGDPETDAWIEPFLTEVSNFPAGSNDDQVDALSDAFNDLALPQVKGAALLEIAERELAEKRAADGRAPEEPPTQYAPGSVEAMMALNG